MFISGTYGTCCTFLILLGPTQTPYVVFGLVVLLHVVVDQTMP